MGRSMIKRLLNRLFTAAVVLLAAAAAPAQKRALVAVPDLPGYKTLKCDFHLHTVFSDGEVWPTTRVMEAWRDGLDAIAITDHDDYHPHKDDVSVNLARVHQIALPAAERAGILLVPGVEISKGDIHFNALFVTDANAFTGLDLTSALTAAKKQGAFLFWNHPGWRGPTVWQPVIEAAHKDGMVHGVELVNGRTFYAEAFPWIGPKKLAILANTDAHAPLPAEQRLGQRPVTLVFARSADLEGIREALTARRTVAWMDDHLWGSAELLKGLWEGAVKPLTAEARLEGRIVRLPFRNGSSIPFEAQLVGKPTWLTGKGTIHPQSESVLALRAGPVPPGGEEAATVELEITNLHPAPGENLRLTLPVRIAARK